MTSCFPGLPPLSPPAGPPAISMLIMMSCLRRLCAFTVSLSRRRRLESWRHGWASNSTEGQLGLESGQGGAGPGRAG